MEKAIFSEVRTVFGFYALVYRGCQFSQNIGTVFGMIIKKYQKYFLVSS